MVVSDSPVPRLGLGTWQNTDFEQCRDSVRTALELGYRHVDTAELYENEEPVGAGVAAADVPRDDVFLATKILHPRYAPDELSRDAIRSKVDGCLERLGVDRVDCMYVHWPHDLDLNLVHATLAELRDEGRIAHVGVSNYTAAQVDRALETDPAIVANQVELHPLLPQPELRARCGDLGVDVVAYAPLAHGEVFDVPALGQVASARGVSVAQVALAWLRAAGVASVPKATSAAHIRDNWASRDLALTDDERAAIDGLERHERMFDPDYAPDW